jgi:hypothetical protein
MSLEEILKHEIANLEIKMYHIFQEFEERFIKSYMNETQEEIKKFTQGFAYRPPKSDEILPEERFGCAPVRENFLFKIEKGWNSFNEKIPNSQSIWVKEDSPYVKYSRYHDNEDIENWKESGALWQYAYPPEPPTKKRTNASIVDICHGDCERCLKKDPDILEIMTKVHYCHVASIICHEENGDFWLCTEKNATPCKFCPFCGYKHESKE